MSRRIYDALVWGLLLLGVVASLYILSGCAADPEPPITAYRRAYGFTP